jgi:hypothetical protein
MNDIIWQWPYNIRQLAKSYWQKISENLINNAHRAQSKFQLLEKRGRVRAHTQEEKAKQMKKNEDD